jgi:hypothetical protein
MKEEFNKDRISRESPPQIEILEKKFKNSVEAGHQWLMPGILATQEAGIRSIAVQS